MKKILSIVCMMFAMAALAQTNNSVIQQVSRLQAETLPFNPIFEPFYHGVASGDPLQDRVIIWTRVTPMGSETSITGKYFVATDTAFVQTVTSGNFTTSADKDFTVKIDVTGLTASTYYYYYFMTNNKRSIVGRTKTIPTASVDNLKFAVVSCSNYEGGLYNAYGRIADRNDLDAVVHLGDYIYEYGKDSYTNPFINTSLLGRINQPASEIINLADYRTRYSLYRLDKDLRRAHQQHPFVTVWDDHESANDSYKEGAENHTEGSEGLWAERKAISKKVYFEWMPIREQVGDKIYRKLSYGNLADLIMWTQG